MSTQDLQASLKAISASRRGAHPAPDELLAYHLGELDPETAEAVEDHLALCSECSGHVLDMARFLNGEPIEDAEPVSDFEVERLKRSVEDALTEPVAVPAVLPFYATLGFARAAAAAFFVTSGALAGLLALNLQGPDADVDSTLANLPILELASEETREPGVDGTNRLPRDAPGAVLVFPLAETSVFSVYEVTFEEAGGEVVFRRSDLRRTAGGLLTLAVQRDFLPAGRYRLRIYGLDRSDERRVLASFQLDWRLD